jgi:hypothetical protein
MPSSMHLAGAILKYHRYFENSADIVKALQILDKEVRAWRWE